jgi:hypothetical protein
MPYPLFIYAQSVMAASHRQQITGQTELSHAAEQSVAGLTLF